MNFRKIHIQNIVSKLFSNSTAQTKNGKMTVFKFKRYYSEKKLHFKTLSISDDQESNNKEKGEWPFPLLLSHLRFRP